MHLKLTLKCIAAAALLASLASCSIGEVRLKGPVDARMLERAKSIPVGSEVHLESMGGEEAYGVEIARLLRSKNADTRVDKYCASACVGILLAGNKKYVSRGAVIVLHNNAQSWLLVDQSVLTPLERRKIKANVDREVAFHREINVDPRYLGCINQWMRFGEAEFSRVRDDGSIGSIRLQTRLTGVLPSRELWEAMGVSGIQSYPDADALVQNVVRVFPKGSFIIGRPERCPIAR
ncbi:hypothetical protein ABOZ73_07640 [Caulobacter sp. 73W]|uniref:Lipoprotein n=1 Tax=Caulobacter sp. 73W TaxID=3161137 RepID=A0AB39KWV8_9CAUL